MPWQTQAPCFNDLHNMQTRKPKEKSAKEEEKQTPEEEELPFGSISMIPEARTEDRSRKNSVRLESLQELYLQLHEDGLSTSMELKTHDLMI
jgi:Leu/Phe-tRNA-protein transferase